ncbi:hypothetical protein MTR_2g034360 [Medicago truncatula]|uniref:Uncharacterized protein n=1 Tax=Medicago truncatula TaxID=3880 RepID=G7IFZ4_MEDTR|nr:hypothetical protein MTR_2g034360 [Medicago truncatula]
MSNRLLQSLRKLLETEEGADDFSTPIMALQTHSTTMVPHRKHYGGRTINNRGSTFNGHGNGSIIDGDFNASTTNYNH